jgi:PAS domain S-box-containing protein
MGETRSSILLVDNDVPSRAVTGRVLRDAGYQVWEAGTASEAVAAVTAAPPDLVLLDMRLPAPGGEVVLEGMEANPATAGTPVMYLSASADEGAAAAGLQEGAGAYLTKPVSPTVLLATVRALLRMGRAQRELQAANRRLQTLLDTLPVGVSIAEDAECRTITTNAAGAALFEAGPERNISASVPVPERPAYRWLLAGREVPADELPLQVAVRENRAVAPTDVEFMMGSGRHWVARTSAAPLHGAGGAVIGGVTAFIDVTQQRQAEEALRESEERYRLLFETMQEGMQLCEIITDEQGEPVDFRYLEVNPVAARILGRTPEELIGRTRNEVLRRPDPKWLAFYGKVALTGRPASAELHATVLGRWFEVHAYSPRPRQFASIITDVTERKRAEQEREQLLAEVRRQQTFLDSVLAQLPAGVVIAEAPSAKVLLSSEGMARIWRRPAPFHTSIADYGEMPGYHRDGRRYAAEEWPLVRAIQGGETVVNEEITVVRGDGSRGTLLSSASPIRDGTGAIVAGVVVSSDITDLKRVQREVERLLEVERARAREARLLAIILENTPSWLAYLDRDLRYLDMNSGYAGMTGRARAAAIGRTFAEIFPEAGEVRGIFEQVRDTGQPQVFHEHRHALTHRPELGDRWFDAAVTPVKGESGEVEGLVVSLTDVTESVQTRERAVAAERARAELAEHLGDEIAHRVKNNLAMVSGLLQMQLLGQRDPEVAAALREAIARVRAFVNIHEQMYSSESQPVSLLALLRSIARSIEEVFATRREAAVSVTGNDLLCPSRVATNLCVVANELLLNALKHGAPGAEGRLRVVLSVTSDEDRVTITVWNSGRPISADFDAARQQNMGLRVVLEVVHGYGGTFALRPDGAGTRAEAVLGVAQLTSTL